jgi:hypothetical protein
MSDPTIRVPNCRHCGMLSSPGESFCRNCGKSLVAPTVASPQGSGYGTSPISTPSIPSITAVAPPAAAVPVVSGHPITVGRKRRSPLLIGCLIFLGLGVVALGAGGIYVWRRTVYSQPERSAPAIPESAAGTMTEFPVDNDSDAPATPTSVETEALGGTTVAKSDSASQTKLPPGVTRTSLAKGATSMTSSTYQPKKKTETPTAIASATENVYICVLTLMPNQQTFGDGLATTIAKETGGDKTGVKVESNTGFVYVGSKIRSPEGNVYVLNKQEADTLILLYSTDQDATVIDRLAQNVGNGQGLFDYPEVKDSLWTLPPSTPPGLTLIEISTVDRSQIENSLISGEKDADAQKIISQMRSLIPSRLTGAKYVDDNRHEWAATTFEYGSTFQAWRNWMLARVWLGLAGGRTTSVRDVSGFYLSQEGMSLLVFQKGPYIIALTGPKAATSDRLVGLGNLFQV